MKSFHLIFGFLNDWEVCATREEVREKAKLLYPARSWLAIRHVFVGYRFCGHRKALDIATFSGSFVARLAHMTLSRAFFGSREEEHGSGSFAILEMMKRGVKKKKGTQEGEAFIHPRITCDGPRSRDVLFDAVVCVEQRPHSI